ncbi:MAG: hypothetical protein ACKO2P_16475 [Planctomycetota bacterium]
MSSAPENPTVHPEDILLFSLISAEFDGELTSAELADLRLLEQRLPEQANAFRVRCARLRDNLQQLPIAPARLPVLIPAVSRPRQTGFTLLRTTSLIATCLTCGLVMVLLFRPLSPRTATNDRVVALTDAPAAPRFAPAPATAAAPSARMAGDRAAAPMASAAPLATAPSAAPPDAMPATSDQPKLLLSEHDWQVVVVRVRHGSPDDVLTEVRQVLARHGLQLARSQPASMPDWLGVCLPASIPHREELLTEVQQGLTADAPEWDPAEIMRSSRESILQAVRQSLASPSRDELVGGEVLVAVSPAAAKAQADQPALLVVFQFSQTDGTQIQ